MSANLPPSFKPIAQYIRIANENASRDPVIYYWCEPSWKKLQELIKAKTKAVGERDELKEYCDDPDGIVKRHQIAESLAIQIEEKRVKCEELRKQMMLVSQKIIFDKRKLAEVQDKITKKRLKEEEIQKQIVVAEKKIKKNLELKEKKQKIINVLTRLVTYRKMSMLEEVVELFKVKIDWGPASRPDWYMQRKCICHHFDCIVNLHLPQSSRTFSHSEIETTEALAYFVQMFNVICKILFYSPRHPIDVDSSPPRIFNPINGKVNYFAGWRKKADRDRFVEAMVWMGRNISQLRSDCGYPTSTADDSLNRLIEWLYLISNEKSDLDRPICRISSPASLLLNNQNV